MSNVFENWTFVHELGEGAFGEVRLAYNTKTYVQYAVKLIRHDRMVGKEDMIKKERLIHQMMNHENIVTLFGTRKTPHITYLFMEYACGGELYDKIEPDIGIKESICQRYFHEILNGVDYLHGLGLAHRDIKPENLLLDENDRIKITDFGMATMFRLHSKVRRLESAFGTPPYMAPEVTSGSYEATGVDIWSSGVVLVTMLAGQLPWYEPNSNCQDFHNFHIRGLTDTDPWNRLPGDARDLIMKILVLNTDVRLNSKQIRKSDWFNKKLPEVVVKLREDKSDLKIVKKLCVEKEDIKSLKEDIKSDKEDEDEKEEKEKEDGNSSDDSEIPAKRSRKFAMSQQPRASHSDLFFCHGTEGEEQITSDLSFFSQPINMSQMLLTPSDRHEDLTLMERLVKRMTRFYVNTPLDETCIELFKVMEKLDCDYTRTSTHLINVNTMDAKNNKLRFKIYIIDMRKNYLLDFRLANGDGLQFKRLFVNLKSQLKSIIKE